MIKFLKAAWSLDLREAGLRLDGLDRDVSVQGVLKLITSPRTRPGLAIPTRLLHFGDTNGPVLVREGYFEVGADRALRAPVFSCGFAVGRRGRAFYDFGLRHASG